MGQEGGPGRAWTVWGLEIAALAGLVMAATAAGLTWRPPHAAMRLAAAGSALGLDFLAWSAWQGAWRLGSRPPRPVARTVPLLVVALAVVTAAGWVFGR